MPEGSKVKYYFTGTGKGRGGGKRSTLPDNVKNFFEEKSFTCVEYNDLTELQERDMFQRVQLGMPLKEGEKLQSIGSEWASWCSFLVHEYVEEEGGLQESLSFTTERGRSFQIIATIVAGIDSLPNFTYKHYASLDKFLRNEGPPPKSLKISVQNALSAMSSLAKTPTLKTLITARVQRFTPVELVFSVVLIHMLRGHADSIVAKEIRNLREAVRRKHEDIRANSRVVLSMWEETKKIYAQYEGGGQKSRSRQLDDEEAAWSTSRPAKKTKRK
ncbi:uncharacterized protein EI90DRAFT_3053932 [Cantharellus anzutake]|uniref:uncharacterized protein n=1 Tax=Cantharellus anzutake TaxID=1750568 RepID=UPI00190857FA|nr:uncharacterized protein EI90DRAFT_3053932 [Cantharellus anzutake]KAF8332657.1 hypothetical protein EI90DRAFT_3053932 [Cantharellus anzutake]